MHRTAVLAAAVAFGVVAQPVQPGADSLAAAAAQRRIHPKTATHVYYTSR
ncbi:MAG: hypothetical protein ABR613_10045 [Actinomycetota bacterium]